MNYKFGILVFSLIAVPLWFVVGKVQLTAFQNSEFSFAPSFYGSEIKSQWSDQFQEVLMKSTSDGTLQAGYFFGSTSSIAQPLVVSLHTWSGDYQQYDPLAEIVAYKNWNYIHPDFRGANLSQESCLGEKVVSDIDDAIRFAFNNGNVDEENVIVIGQSGGGYVALGAYLRSSFTLKAVVAWNPISDLDSWYWESLVRNPVYSKNILQCTSKGVLLNSDVAKWRSPITWEVPPERRGKLEIYAGINDGHVGPVPISHSMTFYNKIVDHYGYKKKRISDERMNRLLVRTPLEKVFAKSIGGRKVYFEEDAGMISIVIFEGDHEMLSDYSVERIHTLVTNSS
jgi:hypothetical protein